MVKLVSLRVLVVLLTFMGALLFLPGHASADSGDGTVKISYTPPFVPITFSLDTSGHLSVSVAENIVTELGDITISGGASFSLSPPSSPPVEIPQDSLLLTIRHYQDGSLVDSSYQIQIGQQAGSADIKGNINEVVVGWTGQSNSVFIDASQGDITSIVVEGASSETTTDVSTPQQPTSSTDASASSVSFSAASCDTVPTSPDQVATALQLSDSSLVGSPQASCGGGKPGGWLIDPNHTGVTVTLSPGMCVDFDGRSATLDTTAFQWIEPSDWQGAAAARGFVSTPTTMTSYGVTVYWSPCYHL